MRRVAPDTDGLADRRRPPRAPPRLRRGARGAERAASLAAAPAAGEPAARDGRLTALALAYGIVNCVQDAWNEQLVKRGTLDWRIPDAILPDALLDLARDPRAGGAHGACPASRVAERRLARGDGARAARRTAELAADYLETLDTRPIRPGRDYAAMLEPLDRAAARRPRRPARGRRGARGRGRAGRHGDRLGPVLRLRRSAARCRRRSRPTGSSRPGIRTPGWRSRRPRVSALEAVTGRWVLELLGLPAELVVRLRDRLPDGARHLPRGGAARRLPTAGWDLPRARPGRRAAAPRRRRRRSAT